MSRAHLDCRNGVLLVAAYSLLANLLLLSQPIYLLQVSDRVLASGSLDTLVMLTLVVGGALSLFAVLDVLRRQVLTRVAMRTDLALGGPVLAAMVAQSQSSGARDVAGLRDLTQLRSFVSGPIVPLLFDAVLSPLYLAVVFVIHRDFGLITTLGAIIIIALAILNQRATARSLAEVGRHAGNALFQAQAQTRNAEVIVASGMLRNCLRLWDRENRAALGALLIASDRNSYASGISRFVRLGLQVAILGWGAYLALAGEITAGIMIVASIIASRALQPVEGAIESWRTTIGAREAYRRIERMLAVAPRTDQHMPLPEPQGRVCVEKLAVARPGAREPILADISFDLAPGEALGVIGPTGAGKSTLARALVGALAPSAGSVRLDGFDLANWDGEQRGRGIGYLPQDIELFPGTVRTNIARMSEDADPETVVAAAKAALVHDLIASLPDGYDTEIGISGAPLSGGQKQRIALARAFYGKPCLLVLDEPNANLDTDGEEALALAIERAKAQGLAILTVTQRPAILQQMDRIMHLQKGRIVLLGPRADVMARINELRRQQVARLAPAPSASAVRSNKVAGRTDG